MEQYLRRHFIFSNENTEQTILKTLIHPGMTDIESFSYFEAIRIKHVICSWITHDEQIRHLLFLKIVIDLPSCLSDKTLIVEIIKYTIYHPVNDQQAYSESDNNEKYFSDFSHGIRIENK